MSSKKSKMLLDTGNNKTNLSQTIDSAIGFFGSIYSELQSGESANIQLTRNRDNSATMRCVEHGKTLVKRPSGKDVGYSYTPKKK